MADGGGKDLILIGLGILYWLFLIVLPFITEGF
jgi:hypothetical protein